MKMNLTRIASILALAATAAFAQAPPPTAGAPGGPPRGNRPPRMDPANLVPPLTESGFQPIFDGKSMQGWEGDTNFWRIENGEIVGETTTDKQPVQNTFLIWRGGSPANFELKLQYKLTGFNSGIQIRSIELPDIKFAMKGYQADMDAQQQYTGQFYEERGRGFLALRGMASYIGTNGKPGLIASTGDNAALKAFIHNDDWNDLHLIARGNTLIQILNGHLMSMIIDDDTTNRKMDGLIGIQVHKGPAMKIEVRNIRIKNL